jgi:hypothetical protein
MMPNELPVTIQEQNKYYRGFQNHPVMVEVMKMWRSLPFFGELAVVHPDVKVATFYSDAITASRVESYLEWFTSDYLTFGRFVAHLLMDTTQGYWTQCIMHDTDHCSITLRPDSTEPKIAIYPTEETQEWATSKDQKIVDLREQLDPELMAKLADGDPIWLDPRDTLFMARKAFPTDYYGTSFLNHASYDHRPSTILKRCGVYVAHLKNPTDFKLAYVHRVEALRERFLDYIFRQKMLPTLTKMHGHRMPDVEWVYGMTEEQMRRYVISMLEGLCQQLGTTMEELEADQRFYS